MPSSVNTALITLTNPKAQASEDYKSIRTKLEYSFRMNETKNIILISSIKPREGKSQLTANLAVSFAQAGKRVLLIDANLREPVQHHYFHISNEEGLSNLLTGQLPLKNAVVRTHIEGLSVIPAGEVTGLHPTELLASETLGLTLRQLAGEFDLVFIDSPAAEWTTDSLMLAAQCDGVVLVAKHKTVKLDEVRKWKKNHEQVNARLIGFVFMESEM
ncbi:CpsD/CapB family tyrosine-protein kinase [Paenibacillus oleatilyticus]|uniref:CpsD/CapB family tyrosine-protein kinase n=1 Tax=Paenibacillus oleatilyticus TaxID=2594886 RepID=UPI001C1FD12D|nr:CpsD/CapB family tyrosine-protein kinase [Paenibacillus oleatilyticus]MBU7320068.1 CpsD/CapB family tyrosine-protein kinase [Paenibacillus oleatilyticus]